MAELKVNVPAGVDADKIARGLELLAKADAAKAKEKAKMQDPAYKAKMQLAGQKTLAYQKLMIEKAKKAGIQVSTIEVETYLKAQSDAKAKK